TLDKPRWRPTFPDAARAGRGQAISGAGKSDAKGSATSECNSERKRARTLRIRARGCSRERAAHISSGKSTTCLAAKRASDEPTDRDDGFLNEVGVAPTDDV